MIFPSPWTASLRRALLTLLLFLGPAVLCAAEAAPQNYVVDEAGVVDERFEQALNARLRELEQKTGAQMIVLVAPTTGGVPIEEFALKQAEAWKLGRKGTDDGLLLAVALRERAYRFEVGYGLEPIVPDSFVGTVGRRLLVPAFRRGAYGEGIYAAVISVTDVIAQARGVTLGAPAEPVPRPRKQSRGNPLGAAFIIFFAFLFLGSVFRGNLSHPNTWGSSGRYDGLGFPAGRSRGGFGSFGGGGFGGFGGGGGGGFGGGGASGGW